MSTIASAPQTSLANAPISGSGPAPAPHLPGGSAPITPATGSGLPKLELSAPPMTGGRRRHRRKTGGRSHKKSSRKQSRRRRRTHAKRH